MAKEVTSLKKAYCPHCKTENELERIFAVSPDAEVCYCPNCLREYKPKEVIDNYNYFIANKVTKAERLLYRDTRFYEAYCAFGDIIEIDSSSCKARFGRIVALIYMSKLKKTNFASAALLLENEAEQYFRKLKEQISYVRFLSKVSIALNEYYIKLHKIITIRDRFYDEDCVALYFQRLHEMIELKRLVLEEIQKSSVKAPDERTEKLMRNVEKSLSVLETQFKGTVIATDGTRYKVSKVIEPNKILVTSLNERSNPISHFVRYKIDENKKRGRLLKDRVYPDNIHITTLTKVALPLFIVFYVLFAGALMTALFTKNNDYDLPLFIGAGCSLLIALVWMVLYIVWKAQLSKRHHLID